ncbi:UNVERIFIED_CONTAM: hypothetical protein K2H54_057562 [Gekko kuhli]
MWNICTSYSSLILLFQVACLIRVPSEVVKQRAQVSPTSSTLRILSNTVCEEGILGLYRGYKSTVLREFWKKLQHFFVATFSLDTDLIV